MVLLFLGGWESASAQRDVQLSPKDPFQLSCSSLSSFKAVSAHPGPIRKFGEHFIAFDPMNKQFHAFDRKGECKEHFELRCKKGKIHNVMAFDRTKEATYFAWFQTFIRVKRGEVGCEWEEYLGNEEKDFSFSQRMYSTPSMRIDTVSGRLIFPIKTAIPDSIPKGGHQVRDAYYQSYEEKGLLAVYPMEDLDGKKGGTPSAYIGNMAPVYKEKQYLPHLDHLHWDLDPSTGKIHLGQMASPKIRVYDQKGELLRTFGKRGESLATDDTLLTIRDPIPRSNRRLAVYRKHQVLSSTYSDLFHDPEHDLLFRVYKAYSKKEKRSFRDMSKGKEGWFSLQLRKPAYLQVYDLENEGELILDRPVGKGPFRPIGMEGRTLYVNRGCPKAFDNSRLKVGTYHLKIEE